MAKTLEKKAPKTHVAAGNGKSKTAAQARATRADARPQDQVQFFDAKLILKPDFFSTVRGFTAFSDLVAEAVSKVPKVKYEQFDLSSVRPRIREVRFLDTPDFRMYNNSFILRRRTMYQDGFPISDPEVVIKYRSSNLEKAAAVDPRPKIAGPYRVKLKAEALPLKDQIGGFRMLYAHNCIFPVSSIHEGDRTNLQTIARIVPALSGLIGSAEGKVDLVNSTLVEEVLMDLGRIDFGKGFMAKANISLWRQLADHQVMCGEFAYQTKFEHKEDIEQKIRERVEELFIKLQMIASGWLYLGCTKTALVYRANGNPPQGHE
jgi:hypothetical protein